MLIVNSLISVLEKFSEAVKADGGRLFVLKILPLPAVLDLPNINRLTATAVCLSVRPSADIYSE